VLSTGRPTIRQPKAKQPQSMASARDWLVTWYGGTRFLCV
jgi:hypothetical protein